MNFNFDMVEKLVQILDNNEVDEELYKEFLELKEVKDFIVHDKELGRKTDEVILKKQIQNTLEGNNNPFECNGFNFIRDNLEILKKELGRILSEEDAIKKSIYDKVERYCPTEKLQDITVYFYGGGLDFGYSIEDGRTYVNIGSLADKMEYFEDIMAHECYHARVRDGEVLGLDFTEENYLRTLLFHILEEGIATLIQFGYPKAYEEFTFITKENFDNTYVYFEKLDRCIKEAELNNGYSEALLMDYIDNTIPNYIVGYKVAEVLFEEGGKEMLNLWSVEEDSFACFKNYVRILREKNRKTGFSREVEEIFLRQFKINNSAQNPLSITSQ